MHHAEHRRAVVHQRDQRAPDRHTRDEGFCAVDWVEHPDIFCVSTFGAEFLADDAVQGKAVLDHPAHHGFGGAVGFGDRIEIVTLVLVFDAERGAKKGKDSLAGGGRQSSDEGGEVDNRHGDSFGTNTTGLECKCELITAL